MSTSRKRRKINRKWFIAGLVFIVIMTTTGVVEVCIHFMTKLELESRLKVSAYNEMKFSELSHSKHPKFSFRRESEGIDTTFCDIKELHNSTEEYLYTITNTNNSCKISEAYSVRFDYIILYDLLNSRSTCIKVDVSMLIDEIMSFDYATQTFTYKTIRGDALLSYICSLYDAFFDYVDYDCVAIPCSMYLICYMNEFGDNNIEFYAVKDDVLIKSETPVPNGDTLSISLRDKNLSEILMAHLANVLSTEWPIIDSNNSFGLSYYDDYMERYYGR